MTPPWYSLHWFLPGTWSQFRFEYPLALYAVPAIGLLFGLRYLLYRRSGQRLNMSIGRPSGLRSLTLLALSKLRYLLLVAVAGTLVLIIVALARPQVIREQRENQSEGIDIMLAIDVSSSMTETDVKPNRLDAARRVAQAFVSGRQNDRIGLVVFAGEAYSLCPLTTDYAVIQQFLADLNDQMIATSGTAIGDALARCTNRMRESTGKSKVIILLSDGDNTAGNLDPVTAARLAAGFGIRLYTIALGRIPARQTSVSGAVQTVDEGILRTIATIGNGRFFRAADVKRLRQIFADINRLERAPVRTLVYQDVQDYYRVYLYWAIALLLFALFLKNTIFGNILED